MGYPTLCCQSVATLDTISISENDMKIKHIRLSREAASTILLLKPGMDRIDKTGSEKVDPMSRMIAMMATTNAMISGKPVIPDPHSYCVLSQRIIRI